MALLAGLCGGLAVAAMLGSIAQAAGPVRRPVVSPATADCAGGAVETAAGPARWTDAGALALADERHLVPEGIAFPTRLSPDRQSVARAAEAATVALAGCAVAPGSGPADRHGRIAGPARLVCSGSGAARLEDLATALVRAGAGYATADGSIACVTQRLSAEAEARAARRGIWSMRGAMLPAADADAVAERIGLFSVVEGRVQAAGGRDRVFVNFGAIWKQDFTVMLAREDFATILGDRLDPAILRGSLIQVRGVVREEGGPAMTLRRRGEVLRIGDGGQAGSALDLGAEAPPSRRRPR